MSVLVLDGAKITSTQAFHTVIEKALQPKHYGRNLDALWDLLTMQQHLRVIITHNQQLISHLGSQYIEIMTLFNDLKEACVDITIEIQSE